MATVWWLGRIERGESEPSEVMPLDVRANRRGTTGTVETLNKVVDAALKQVSKSEDWSIILGDETGPDREIAYHSHAFPGVLYVVNQPRMDDLRATEQLGTGRTKLQVAPAPELLQVRWTQDPSHYPVRHIATGSPFPGELVNLDHYADASYGNDISPSLTFSIGDVPYVLWIAPARVFERTGDQVESGFRTYELQRLVSSGNLEDDFADKQADADVLSTDDPAELSAEITRLYNEVAAHQREERAGGPAKAFAAELGKLFPYNGWQLREHRIKAPAAAKQLFIAEHPRSELNVQFAQYEHEPVLHIVVMDGEDLVEEKDLPWPKSGRTPQGVFDRVKHTLDEYQPIPAPIDATAERYRQMDLDREPRRAAPELDEDDSRTRFSLLELNPADRDDVIALVVIQAATSTPAWQSSSKRFISDVYETVVRQGRDGGMSLDEFKRELVRLHRAGKIRLARADLVAAMPAVKVRRSEVRSGPAEFHFVDVRNNPAPEKRTVRLQKVVSKLERDTSPTAKNVVISRPEDAVAHILQDFIADRATESFVVLFINVRNKVIGYTEYTSGSTIEVEVHVSGIMRDALEIGAIGIVTAHNHPTGNPEPSSGDRELWGRIRSAGTLLGIPVVDNLIVTSSGVFYSESADGTGRITPRAR